VKVHWIDKSNGLSWASRSGVAFVWVSCGKIVTEDHEDRCSEDPSKVTCGNCKRLKTFKQAVEEAK
jgi:hypothetical protein